VTFMFVFTTITAILSFLLMAGIILPGAVLLGDLAPIIFAGSSMTAVFSALAIDAQTALIKNSEPF
jgi:hypothetical protein